MLYCRAYRNSGAPGPCAAGTATPIVITHVKGRKMTLDSFYAIVSGTCFALVGLWWGVVQFNKSWLRNDETRALAGGIYLSFLIPGVMSLIAQVSGDNKIIWRATFVIAAALGMYFTARLIVKTRTSTEPIGPFRRHRWIVIMLYLLVLIF